MKRRLIEPRFPLRELFGYTPGVLAKSAEAVEKKEDDFRSLERERKSEHNDPHVFCKC